MRLRFLYCFLRRFGKLYHFFAKKFSFLSKTVLPIFKIEYPQKDHLDSFVPAYSPGIFLLHPCLQPTKKSVGETFDRFFFFSFSKTNQIKTEFLVSITTRNEFEKLPIINGYT